MDFYRIKIHSVCCTEVKCYTFIKIVGNKLECIAHLLADIKMTWSVIELLCQMLWYELERNDIIGILFPLSEPVSGEIMFLKTDEVCSHGIDEESTWGDNEF